MTENELSTCEASKFVHQTEASVFAELVIKVVQMPVILRSWTKCSERRHGR